MSNSCEEPAGYYCIRGQNSTTLEFFFNACPGIESIGQLLVVAPPRSPISPCSQRRRRKIKWQAGDSNILYWNSSGHPFHNYTYMPVHSCMHEIVESWWLNLLVVAPVISSCSQSGRRRREPRSDKLATVIFFTDHRFHNYIYTCPLILVCIRLWVDTNCLGGIVNIGGLVPVEIVIIVAALAGKRMIMT